MTDGGIVVVMVVGIALSLGASLGSIAWSRGWMKTSAQRHRRRLDRLPTVRIADVKPGAVVKIAGRVEAIAADGADAADALLLEAPLTGQRALAFVTHVQVHDEERNGPGSFTPYRQEKQALDFRVRDESGVALVRVDRANVVAEPRGVADQDGRQKRWLRKVQGRSRFLFVVPRKLVYAETALRLGAEVVVLGRCVASPAGAKEGPYREAGGEPMITLEAPRSSALVVSWRD